MIPVFILLLLLQLYWSWVDMINQHFDRLNLGVKIYSFDL